MRTTEDEDYYVPMTEDDKPRKLKKKGKGKVEFRGEEVDVE